MFNLEEVNNSFLVSDGVKNNVGIKFPFVKISKKPEVGSKSKQKIELGVSNKNFNPVLTLLGIKPDECKGQKISIVPADKTNRYAILVKGDFGMEMNGVSSSKITSVLQANQTMSSKPLAKFLRDTLLLSDEEQYFIVKPTESQKGLTIAILEPVEKDIFDKYVEEGVENFEEVEEIIEEEIITVGEEEEAGVIE